MAIINGPMPVLSDYGEGAASAARTAARNESELFKAFYIRAGLGEDWAPRNQDPDWLIVTLAGINAVDEQCERYLDSLFWVRRDLDTARNQIDLVGTTAATLLNVFHATADAITATAAAFGLATQGIGNASEGILFSVEPSGIRKIVERAQARYRAEVERNPGLYNSRPAAFAAIQGYLALCLPAAIEAQINESVSLTDFRVAKTSSGAVPELTRVGTIEDRISAGDLAPDAEKLIRGPVPPTPQANAAPANCRGDECRLSLSQGKDVQRSLCFAGDAVDADFGAATRAAISEFEGTVDPMLVTRSDGELSDRESSFLIGIGPCEGTPFRSTYERFTYGSGASGFQAMNTARFAKLIDLLKGTGDLSATAAPTGLDESVRAAVRAAQERQGLTVDGRVTRALVDSLAPG